MKAIITKEAGGVSLVETQDPTVSAGQALIRIQHAALNRRDQWIREGLYPGIRPNVILGSDGCGIVEQPTTSTWLGKEVIINPNLNWGGNADVQSEAYNILGLPRNGTLASYIVIEEDRLQEKPAHLSTGEAGALPLAGLTAYRAVVTKGELQKGMNVLISGIGGGVAQFAMQFSLALGANVYVTSGSQVKIDKAIALGAKDGFLYHEDSWSKKALSIGGMDVIVDGAGGQGVNHLMKTCKPGGKVVIYGATAGKIPDFDVRKLFWSQIRLIGSTMGNDQEFEDMVRWVSEKEIHPVIDKVFPMEDYVAAFDRFKHPDHFGKIVLKT